MNSDSNPLLALLHRAGDLHHEAFAHVNGEDAEWAEWYARVIHPDWRTVVGVDSTVEQIAALLTEIEDRRRAESPDAEWAGYYASALERRFGLE